MSLVPLPAAVVPARGAFALTTETGLTAPDALHGVLAWLQGALRAGTGLPLCESASGSIRLELEPDLAPESYRLRVTPDHVRIEGGDPAGVFYGCQTLLQLLPPAVHRRSPITPGTDWVIGATTVTDAPRFPWRGVLLDVARHFMPVHGVLRLIDQMAAHRLNRLHLHLTDDQGWRLEIGRYPRLTSVGGWRTETQLGSGPDAGTDGRPHGGYYTHDDIREIVAYAAGRFITVVPEIEMPGHVRAALAAYPELGAGAELLPVWTRWGIDDHVLNAEEHTVRFFCDVLDEVIELFPSPYVCVGGDEAPKTRLRDDPALWARAAELGLDSVDRLPGWFLGRIGRHLAGHGRRMLGWDDLLEGDLPAGTTLLSWRGMSGAVVAARRGHDVISCPDNHAYLDYRQSDLDTEPIPQSVVLDLDRVYAFEPVPAELSPEEAGHVIGGQANIWTEYMDSGRVVDYFAFPRLAAIAEVLWTPARLRDLPGFRERMETHLLRLEAMGIEFRRSQGPKPWQQRPGIAGRPRTEEERDAHIARITGRSYPPANALTGHTP
ncbi:beta-N-acetylhexosaminidase [Nonomuraea sp. NPDC051941]|uniref:beta-N-acetylhexosaminidase n=1 Tax=Nonomuraea sp. NPDC051941 TaxID=3364373 RepID=UPI0037C862A7